VAVDYLYFGQGVLREGVCYWWRRTGHLDKIMDPSSGLMVTEDTLKETVQQ
jgi:hypothetical protein